jgi:hypothetical protein
LVQVQGKDIQEWGHEWEKIIYAVLEAKRFDKELFDEANIAEEPKVQSILRSARKEEDGKVLIVFSEEQTSPLR